MATTRRDFLKLAGAAGSALVVGFRLEPGPPAAPAALKPDGWLRVGKDGRVTITVGKSEMGQGVYTSMPMLIAEELNVDINKIKVAIAPPNVENEPALASTAPAGVPPPCAVSSRITPPIAELPYSVLCGPRNTSTRSSPKRSAPERKFR